MSTWYFKDTKAEPDYLWSNANNWWSSPDGTGSHPAAAPWTTDSASLNADNLSLVSGETPPIIECTIGNAGWTNQITGECNIDGVTNNGGGIINDGTFSGAVINYLDGDINDGTFSGAVTNNCGGGINGGTFSGAVTNSGGYINGGTFSGLAVVSILRNGIVFDGAYGLITLTNDKASVLDVLGTGLL